MTDTAHAVRTGTSGDDVLTGTAGDDRISGLRGNDVLYGRDGADHLDGGGGHDRLFGDAGEDWLEGGFGNDRLYGGNDADRLYGDAGDDQIFGQHGHDIAHGGDGDDRIVGDIGRDTLYGDADDDILSGGEGADRLFGGTGNDELDGGADDDLIAGNEGHDIAHGGDGNDRMLGGSGRDSLYGDDGHDTLIGDAGGDRLFGGLGNDDLDGGADNDQLVGNEGHDTIHGGDGKDRVFGNDGRDQLYGDAGDDMLVGGNGADRLDGGEGRDDLDGGEANDFLYGGLGNDRLTGGLGNDRIDGGAGNDTAIFSGDYADYLITLNGTTATVTGPDGTDTLTSIEFLQFDDRRVRIVLDPVSENPPVITSAATTSVAENQTAAYTVTATDADGVLDTLTYSISGTDAALFDIDSATGVVTFKAAPDFETPGDAGGDNVYDVVVSVYDGQFTTSQAVAIAVTNENDSAPVLTSSASASVAENQTAAYTVIATDADGDALSYALSGTDAAFFDIDSVSGAVTFKAAPDFESPGDAGGDNVYDVTVSATDGVYTTDQIVAIEVTSENEFAPVFASGSSVRASENQSTAYQASATDGDGDALGYSLSGTDAALFAINSATGVVRFRLAPDFEAPADAGRNNVYNIIVTADDGQFSVDRAVAIRVLDINENALGLIDLTSLSGSEGFVIQGDYATDFAGASISSAGDLNGDGFDDFIVGANGGDDGGNGAGEAYVIFGTGGGFGADVLNSEGHHRQVIDLTALSANEGFIIQGDYSGDQAGFSVASAGDVNGDGYDDLIIGADRGGDGGSDAGEAYIVFGSASGFGTDVGGRQVIDLTGLSAAEGFIIQGATAQDNAGTSVSSAGDVNGDGYDDMIVGTSQGRSDLDAPGEAYVVFGSASGFGVDVGGRQVIDLASLSATEGFIIRGDAAFERAGFSVSSAGDVNGDGFADIMVGAPYGGNGGYRAGQSYVVFGSAAGFGTDIGGRQVIDLTDLSVSQGFIIQGDSGGGYAGRSVSSAGDINGDGYDDLILGAANTSFGEAYVVFGSASGFGSNVGGRQVIDLTNLTASQGFIMQGTQTWDLVGESVSSAGDVNGDGYDDIIVGAGGIDLGESNAGAAYIVFGSASGFGTAVGGRQVLVLANLAPADGFIVQGDARNDNAGGAVSSAGDVNGDGFDDLLVGAQSGDDGGLSAGEAYIIFGSAGGTTGGITAAGTSGANTIIGGAGDDTLTGNGGADVIRSGAGDDIIGISDNGFFRIDGGRGDDTLRVDGAGVNLNFGDIAQNSVTDIERIDLTGSGDNSLTVSSLDIFDMMEAREGGSAVLRVTGDAGDAAYLSDAGWASTGQTVEGSVTYNTYTNGNAQAWVEDGVAVTLGSSGPSLTTVDAGKAEIAPVMAVLDADASTDALPGPGFGIDLGQIGWDSHGFLILGDGGDAPVRAFGRDGGGWTSRSADTPWGDQHHLPDAHGGRFLHHRPAEIAIGQDLAGPGAVNDVPLPAAIELPGFAILSHDALPVSVPVFGHPPGPASGFPAADTILFAGDTPFDVTPAEAIEGWH